MNNVYLINKCATKLYLIEFNDCRLDKFLIKKQPFLGILIFLNYFETNEGVFILEAFKN